MEAMGSALSEIRQLAEREQIVSSKDFTTSKLGRDIREANEENEEDEEDDNDKEDKNGKEDEENKR